MKAKPRVAGSRPAAPALPDESLQKAQERAASAERAVEIARPALNALGTKPSGAKPDINGGIFPAVPGRDEAPQ
jgi:hypothetical protein